LYIIQENYFILVLTYISENFLIKNNYLNNKIK